MQRTFHDVLVKMEGASGARAGSIHPERVTIGIRGQRELIYAIDPTVVRAHVNLGDLAGLSPGRYNLPVAIESQEEIRITHIDPTRVQVNLR